MNSGYRVLLVDDNDLNRILARAIQKRSTHPISAQITLIDADTLATTRTALAAAPVDMILLDMNLPDGHGLTLVTELSRQPTRPVIVAITASVLPEDQQAVHAAGCDGFLGKPYQPQQLIDTLAAHLTAR